MPAIFQLHFLPQNLPLGGVDGWPNMPWPKVTDLGDQVFHSHMDSGMIFCGELCLGVNSGVPSVRSFKNLPLDQKWLAHWPPITKESWLSMDGAKAPWLRKFIRKLLLSYWIVSLEGEFFTKGRYPVIKDEEGSENRAWVERIQFRKLAGSGRVKKIKKPLIHYELPLLFDPWLSTKSIFERSKKRAGNCLDSLICQGSIKS